MLFVQGNAIDTPDSITATSFRQSQQLGEPDDAIDPPSYALYQPSIPQRVRQQGKIQSMSAFSQGAHKHSSACHFQQ